MSNWVIKCMGCGKTRTDDEPGCPDCSAKQAHAERLQAATCVACSLMMRFRCG